MIGPSMPMYVYYFKAHKLKSVVNSEHGITTVWIQDDRTLGKANFGQFKC